MKNQLVLPIIDSKTRESTLLHFRKQPYKPKKKQALIPNLKRDLKPGWLLTILAQIDRCLWGRWDYWALCQAVPAHAWMRWKMEPMLAILENRKPEILPKFGLKAPSLYDGFFWSCAKIDCVRCKDITMLVFEAKLEGLKEQYDKLDEAIRTARFIRNSCLRYWMDNRSIGRYDLSAYCAVLAQEFAWASKLNSQARQASSERAWSAIARFFDRCKKNQPGKKGYPKFKKEQTHGSVEYKTTGWKLSDCRKYITFTDGFGAGTFLMWGTRDLHFYQLKQIKRVRVIRRADGYYTQFCIDFKRVETREPTLKTIGLDVGLTHFYTDSDGQRVENPRHLRKSEKSLKRLARRFSKTKKGSKNRAKLRNKLARKHLKVSRQRKDFAVKLARCVVQSNDLVAYEDLKVRNMVKNRHLAKSISDAAWTTFRGWVEYFGKVFGVVTVAVPPHYTSQNCSNCGKVVKKSLSVRTHVCHHCGHTQDRDWNAARNILEKGLRTAGHVGTSSLRLENASGDIDLCLGGETLSNKPSRGKRKPKK